MTLTNRKLPARDNSGRFCNSGAYRVAHACHPTAFTPVSEARPVLRLALERANRTLRKISEGEGVACAVIRASPGAGKSTLQRQLMAERAAAGQLEAFAFHVPTRDLAAEAAIEASEQGLLAQAIRGRSAPLPNGNGLMCAKADLVEQASRIGLSVREHFCETKDDSGSVRRCPHFDRCAFLEQFKSEATCHFLATAYLGLPNPGNVVPDLRVVDETFWRESLMISDIDVVAFKEARAFLTIFDGEMHMKLRAAAKHVVRCLEDGGPLSDLPYTEKDYAAFAQVEWKGQLTAKGILPDQDVFTQKSKLAVATQQYRSASRFAAVWNVLREVRRAGLPGCERLRLLSTNKSEVIRVLRKRPFRHQEPMLILDSDADTEILKALGCDIRNEHQLTLRPNAHVVQVHDHQMSMNSLLNSKSNRDGCRMLIAKEVLRDRLVRNAGVLVGAPKSVVRAMFEDAGYDFRSMNKDEITETMLTTKLHGARWLWFGSRSLGSNLYKDCASVIVLGRQELPVSALEDQGRALWGDTEGEPLNFVRPDVKGAQWLPYVEAQYEMADGSRMAVEVPCHPDPRIRRLQFQSRELATRQLVERLRLAHAPYRKRVILTCNIPIPGLPVNELVSWETLVGCRVEAAISMSLVEQGEVAFDYKSIAAGAPTIFATVEAVSGYLKRNKLISSRIKSLKKLAKPFGGTLKIENCSLDARHAKMAFTIEDLLSQD